MFNQAMAQKITISIPNAASKRYAFFLNEGIDQDTIQKGTLNIAGGTIINIPTKYKDYTGIGILKIEGENSINLVVNHENFTIERGADLKNKFKNSPENEYLYATMEGRQQRDVNVKLYAARFVELAGFTGQLNNVVNKGGDLNSRTNIRIYAIDKLDMDGLYTSGLWHLVVDRLARLSSNQEVMANDFIKIFKRIKSQKVYEHLADNVITMMNQYGWDDAFDILIPSIADSKRILTPQGKIYDAFKMVKIRRGNFVPPIEGLKIPLKENVADKTLIMFYESDCQNCITQLQELKKNYARLNASKIRVITISADYDKKSFDKESSSFPWVDKLCDYKGFAGKNFSNFGVLGTPTFYLLDKDLRLIKRFALFRDANI